MAGNERFLFSTLDYSIFVLLLAGSALIGLYYGFLSKRKQDNTAEYLLGGKSLGVIPVSLSLVASFISGISILGIPSEMYLYGTQYANFLGCCVAVGVSLWFVYLPVFHELQLTSCFSYLEKRFDKRVKLTASFLYALSMILYMPIVIYVPALAFNQTTGINVHLITPVACIVCLFYTTFGGLRAVVWTDALQFVVMVGATLIVIYLGLDVTGGFAGVWKAADKGGRLIFFNMDPNPFVRSSFWTVTFGLSVSWIGLTGTTQSTMQRFLSVPNLKKARQALVPFTLGKVLIKACCCFLGLVVYARYQSCDPFTMGDIQKMDQILPYFVLDVAGKIPGLPGLFIAGIFAAALSTLSSCWNTLSGTIYEDFVRGLMPTASEKRASTVMKWIVVLLGVITIGMTFVAEKMGTVLQLTITIQGLTGGTMLGLFTFGMLFRKGNTKGVITGAITGFLLVATITFGARNIKYPGLPMSVEGCGNDTMSMVNVTSATPTTEDDTFILFKLSNMYYTLVGVCTVFIVAYVVSVWTGGYEVKDERLFAPFMRKRQIVEKELQEVEYLNIAEVKKLMESEK